MPAGFIEQFATRLKACVSHIFSGSDGQGKQPGFTHQGPGQLNTSNENAPSFIKRHCWILKQSHLLSFTCIWPVRDSVWQ